MRLASSLLIVGLLIWQLVWNSSNLEKGLLKLSSVWEEASEDEVFLSAQRSDALAQDDYIDVVEPSNRLASTTPLRRVKPDWILTGIEEEDEDFDDDGKIASIFGSQEGASEAAPIDASQQRPKESLKQRSEAEQITSRNNSEQSTKPEEPITGQRRKIVIPVQTALVRKEELPTRTTTGEQFKPNLIIHIGPSKTGTNTIQRESSYRLFQPLGVDNYYYVGKFGDRQRRSGAKIPNLLDDNDCFRQAVNDWKDNKTTSFRETECWKERISGIEEYRQKNQSLILSDESYSYLSKYRGDQEDYYDMLRVAFQDDWNVLIVPTYRRYFEWILSVAKEMNRKGCHQPTVAWNTTKGCNRLWSRVKFMLLRDDFEGSPFYANLDTTVPIWQNAGFNVSILNFHSPRHLTCSFYCDHIPNTPNTCKFCLKQASEQLNKQEVSTTAYNDIVYEAASQGVINVNAEKRSRHEITKELADYHEKVLGKSFRDLPLICPPKDMLENLLSKSLVMELRTLPTYFHSPQGEKEHRSSFWQAADEAKAFCWVDVRTLLEGKQSWEQVLVALNTTATWPVQIHARHHSIT